MVSVNDCLICNTEGAHWSSGPRQSFEIDCPRCGNFNISHEAHDAWLRRREPKPFVLLSGLIRARCQSGELRPDVRLTTIQSLASMRAPPLKDRIDSVLLCLERHSPRLGAFIHCARLPELLALGYCHDDSEFHYLLSAAAARNFIVYRQDDDLDGAWPVVAVATPGYERCDELRQTGTAGHIGFVAMWFDPTMDEAFSIGFSPAIRNAGYTPHRVDSVEHVGRIDDEIIRQIRAARFVVADYTGHRGGVYYEAGFAHGLNLPLFMTCREDNMKDLHFDIRQYNCIGWKNPDDLAKKLRNRIEAVLGRGPIDPAMAVVS